jgi:hypothetical protein
MQHLEIKREYVRVCKNSERTGSLIVYSGVARRQPKKLWVPEK